MDEHYHNEIMQDEAVHQKRIEEMWQWFEASQEESEQRFVLEDGEVIYC